MVQIHAAKHSIQKVEAHILILEARFYDALADHLLEGAKAALEAAGATFQVASVPGALEIPIALAIAAESDLEFDGAIALGCVIRGETGHYDIVAGESSNALMKMGVDFAMPIGNGILTVENMEQALVRAKINEMDKGGDAARACISLIALRQSLAEGQE